MWYNEKTNILQSNPPYRGWLHPEEVPILYPEWKEVPDDFKLPDLVPTKDELLEKLEQEYEPQFNDLRVAWANAYMKGNTEVANARVNDRKALEVEYNQRMEVIMNGN